MSAQSTTTLRKRFEELVRAAEAEIEAQPGVYKFRLALLAGLGYAVIFGLLAVLILILGGTIYGALLSSGFLILLINKKIFIVLIAAVWVLVRSLLVSIRAPEGLAVSRKDAPGLWREIDDLRRNLRALPLHRVVLVPDMNAAVAQTPRLGLMGPYKNTLVLGLELLMTLTPAQARSVLAHEFGHLSGQHGRFGNWIYRKRLTWARIGQAFGERSGIALSPMTRFINWYVPRLVGYSFALARSQEYEADAVAARLTSPEDAAAALMLVRVRDEITRDLFWKPLLGRAIRDPDPEAHTFTRLFEHLKTKAMNSALADAKIGEALRTKTGYADTHPSLRDRLKAIKAGPVALATGPTAAEAWLGDHLESVLRHFDRQWLEQNRDAWRQRHEGAQQALAYLATLEQKPVAERTQSEAWEIVSLQEDVRPETDPLPGYLDYAGQYPDDPDGHFAIGRLLVIERDDASGVAHLEKAAEHWTYREVASGIIAAHYQGHDQAELAETWLAKAEAAHDDLEEARHERSDVFAGDTFQATRLDDEFLALLVEAIRRTPAGQKIKSIWIAEKVLRQLPDAAVHVVVAEPKVLAWGKRELGQTLATELGESFPFQDTWFFLPAISSNRAIAGKVKAVGKRLAI